MSINMKMTSKLALGAMVACLAAAPLFAQKLVPMTAEETNLRNIGTPGHPGNNAAKDEPAPPHKIIGNLYYVGTTVHCNYLIVTPQGDILINTGYEHTWPMTQASIEKLGFKVSDIKIILGSHAHVDHQEADAMVKQLTGAPVEVMDKDVPMLQKLTPGGKPHPIDKILHDGDTVSLGGSSWVAHLHGGAYAGLHDLDLEDRGRRQDLQRGDHVRRRRSGQAGQQPGLPERRGRFPPHLCLLQDGALRYPAGLAHRSLQRE